MEWYQFTAEAAQEIVEKNRNGEVVSSLEDYSQEESQDTKEVQFENVVGQDSLNRFDRPKNQNKKRSGNHNRNRNRRRSSQKND